MTQDDLTKLALIKLAQEQQQARVDVITVTLMREGINKHRARELADHFVNFTSCIGKDPRCPCQDGDACHYKDCGGTKAWPVPKAEPPPEWPLIKNILDEYGLQAIDFVAEFKAAQQVATIWKQAKPFSPEAINTTQTAWRMGYEAAKAEPVGMRMPKVGDRVICLEDESLGTIVSLTAGGSPDIVFDDDSRGTYLLREFAELFGYAEQRQQQAEPVAYFDFQELKFTWAKHMKIGPVPVSIKVEPMKLYLEAPQQQAEPTCPDCKAAVLYECVACSNNNYPPKQQAEPPQRQWVGLTEDDIAQAMCRADAIFTGPMQFKFAKELEAKLKEKNDH